MATLLVRGIDEALVQRLRERAAAHGRSAEAEHREILAQALSARTAISSGPIHRPGPSMYFHDPQCR
ncbi:FitA-like ribbon-helix-helix domain-containing protein [Cupriavidus sp. 30B13]|uniref:FitA-like ribbon-helix-helix domain-containing protein n=1 Tax=Cupriavidus sp. 30B13 TaxID=3384241 RepID=UPI003B913496